MLRHTNLRWWNGCKAFIAGVTRRRVVLAAVRPATGQPAPNRCTALFALSDVQGAMASADLKNDSLERLYVEMGPARAALITDGAGVSGAYKVQTSELTYWHYMSIYEPAKAWLTPASVRLFYSGSASAGRSSAWAARS